MDEFITQYANWQRAYATNKILAGLPPAMPLVENPGISYSNILILIPDSRTVYDLIFTLFILLTLSR